MEERVLQNPIVTMHYTDIRLSRLPALTARSRKKSTKLIISGVEIKDIASAVLVVSRNSFAFSKLPRKYIKNKEVTMAAVRNFAPAINDAVEELQQDRDVIITYLQATEQLRDQYASHIKDPKIPKKLMRDPEILALWELKRYQIFPTFRNTQIRHEYKLDEAKDPFIVNTKSKQRSDKQFLLRMFALGKCLLVNLPAAMRRDPDIIIAAIRQRAKTIHQVPVDCVDDILVYKAMAANPLLLFEIPELIAKEIIANNFLHVFGVRIVTRVLVNSRRVDIVRLLSTLRTKVSMDAISIDSQLRYEVLKLLVQAMNLINTSTMPSIYNWKLIYKHFGRTKAMQDVLPKIAREYLLPNTQSLWPELNRHRNFSKAKTDEIFEYANLERLRLFSLVTCSSECTALKCC